MNLKLCTVTKILDGPVYIASDRLWSVSVQYKCNPPIVVDTELLFNSLKEAKEVSVGFKFIQKNKEE